MKWIVEAKAFEYDKHYSDCKKSNQPFIKARINRSTGRYLVFLDLATCSGNLSDTGKEKLETLFESISDSVFSVDAEYSTIDGVPSERLNEFLADLYNLTEKYRSE